MKRKPLYFSQFSFELIKKLKRKSKELGVPAWLLAEKLLTQALKNKKVSL